MQDRDKQGLNCLMAMSSFLIKVYTFLTTFCLTRH